MTLERNEVRITGEYFYIIYAFDRRITSRFHYGRLKCQHYQRFLDYLTTWKTNDIIRVGQSSILNHHFKVLMSVILAVFGFALSCYGKGHKYY